MSGAVHHLKNWISFSEYATGETVAEERHEYVDGKGFAVAGAGENHEIVASNLFAAIHQHMKGKGCRVFKGDMKLKIALHRRDLGYYPDIMVTCDPKDTDQNFKTSPKLLIEVMSNYRIDHVKKLFAYQQIPALERVSRHQLGPSRETSVALSTLSILGSRRGCPKWCHSARLDRLLSAAGGSLRLLA